MNVNCEDFEREFAAFLSGDMSTERREALEEHRRTCPYCRRFNEEYEKIRDALIRSPQLEVPPYFVTNLKREINRMEQGIERPDWSSNSAPRLVALSTGFAAALILGFLVLQPGQQQHGYPSISPSSSGIGSMSEENNPNTAPDFDEQTLVSDPSELWYASERALIDTIQHRIPERPGTDSIPIPVEDDLWRIDRVSTTPGEP